MHVYKDDITEHVCDAILNASNPELNLLPGGVSGAIQTKGGKSIQKQMHEITSKQGNLFAGDAASTLSGSLQNCQVIIHAVGPRWHENSHSQNCKYLQSCISSAMEEAEKRKLSSVANPAISCGVFGGQPGTCVPLIVETVLDYFKQHRGSSI
uniref:Macro domain-containing protein n=1 Tax=Ciona savignyi TaxID=51511 RepID=H2Z391_CIOSA